jgi:hypothetical protein
MHGRVLFLLSRLLEGATASPTPGAGSGLRNLFGPIADADRYSAGGLMHSGTDTELRLLMRRLAQRIASAAADSWSVPLPGAAEKWENPYLPSGYTYLLQFIAHDLVDSGFSTTGLGNIRGKPLSLEAIYGSGPDEFPHAYEFDEEHAQNQSQIPRRRLRLGPERRRHSGTFACPFRDIARTEPTKADNSGNPEGWLTEPLVADPRNDSNFLVSQLTVVWHLLHNQLVALRVENIGDPSGPSLNSEMARSYRRFLCARSAVMLIYRNIIEKDVLPKILHPLVRARYAKFRSDPGVLLDQGEGLPLEFTHGAFRFGHAMVRDSYRVNREGGDPLATERAIKHSNLQFRVPSEWLVDWARFFDLREGNPAPNSYPVPNFSRRIGPDYAAVMRDSTLFSPKRSPDEAGLPDRDLLSASYAGVWSVARLFDKLEKDFRLGDLVLGLEAGSAVPRQGSLYDVWREPIRQWLRTNNDLIPGGDIEKLSSDPPLPFFVLFEAAHELHRGAPVTPASGGILLGPLGSIIVAETIYGALSRHPIPFEQVGPTLKSRLQECCAVLAGNDQALAHVPEIETMSQLICFLIDEGVFRQQQPSQSAQVI